MGRNLDELEFLSSATIALAELDPDADVFAFIAEKLAELAPDSLVVTTSYDPSVDSTEVRAAAGPVEMLEAGRELAGEPLGLEFPVDEQGRRILAEGELVRLEEGMHQLTFRAWPADLARRFEERLGIAAVFGQPFSRGGDFLGAAAFLSRSPTLEHARLIEVFVRVAAVAILRRRAAARLREADRRKSEFLAILSHELRNPLGSIRNAAHVLRRVELKTERGARALAVIERQIAHLTRLIGDLLDVTRVSRGRIELKREPVDLNELVRTTADELRPEFERKRIDLEVVAAPREVTAFADPDRAVQILDNLLQNAAKFTPPGGRASIAVRAARPSREAILTVSNTGPTIPKEVVERLFEPFVQADRSLDRRQGGLGLGLPLIKGLVELHGGALEVKSEHDETAFTVRLPLAPERESEAAERKPPPESAALRPRRVLVIEDNPDAADSLREVLELGGHEVAVASDGAEGLAKARAHPPEVVLCDIGLPGMDGYEVARAIRADPALSSILLIALTGYAMAKDVDRAREAGFDQHLAKPPSLEALEAALTGTRGEGTFKATIR